ncbi:CDP-alcohol phosphatidyltransferase family protein [Candidatus Gracilibacteria bacterium]|nr:CDP-alcohol phosphatidyltransferase family protein [Candidatus Gracilibacteria bacterium]
MEKKNNRKLTLRIAHKLRMRCSDCFSPWSPSERGFKKRWEKIQKVLFFPLLKLFVKLHIRPNTISYLSALVAITGSIYIAYDLHTAGILIFISLILDGLDGPLARYTDATTPKGAITDCFTDEISTASLTIAMILNQLVHPLMGSLYLFLHPIVIMFTVLRNVLNVPNKFVFRGRMIITFVFLYYVFGGINYLDLVFPPTVGILLGYSLCDFVYLRKMIR